MKTPSVLGIISFKVFPAQMGGQKGVASFYTHLAQRTKVVLAVAKENGAINNKSCEVFSFLYHHKKGLRNLRYIFRLQKLIKQQEIDIVCIEHSYMGWLGILLRWLTKKPFVIHSHNIEAHRFRDMHKPFWWIYQWYEKWVHAKADHSFFITEEDRYWAIKHFHLPQQKCTVITYGTGITGPLPADARQLYRNRIIKENGLPGNTKLFLFNGTLDYLPNTDALRIILSELLLLLQAKQFPFRILVCGNRLSGQWQKELSSHSDIIYKGFVPDIELYFKGADCFINPVTLGSGIKTKLVDALSHNQPCISTKSGANGVPQLVAGPQLALVDDYNWQGFADTMYHHPNNAAENVPAAFYEMFNWDSIVQKALLSLQTL